MISLKQNTPGIWPVVLTPFCEDGSIDFCGYDALLDYYYANNAAGLFAVCLSSELYQLSAEEKIALAERAVKRMNGRIPVVVSGGFGDSPQEKIDSIKRMAATGADAVVIPVGLLCGREESEETLAANFASVLAATGEIRLGLYECPLPYHRLLSPECLGRLVRSAGNRLVFLKDTCCDAAVIRRKLAAAAGSSLGFYNANLFTLLESLRDGAAGYCGTSANYYPAQLAELCAIFREDPVRAEEMQRFFNLIQRHVEFKYPRYPKMLMRLQGVPIGNFCRVPCDPVSAQELEQGKILLSYLKELSSAMLVTGGVS